MQIKEFEKQDKDVFLRLCNEFYTSHATQKPFNRETAARTFDRVIERHENLWGYLFTDKETSQPIGYALVSAYWCNEEGGNILVLDELYICPASRHHGYGGVFLKWLENEFRDRAAEITLEVLNTNQSAQTLYKKDGLQPDGFVTFTKTI